jgi:hypothetical protein
VSEAWREELFGECLRRLDQARTEYWRATKGFLGPTSDLTSRKANLHWLLGQVLSLDIILGRPFNTAAWTAARLAAQIDTENASDDVRAWAYVSLSELALLRLADQTTPVEERRKCAESALSDAIRVVELVGRSAEHVQTTTRQFERYTKLWGNPELADALARLGVPTRQYWWEEHGLVSTAEKVVEAFRAPVRPATK